MRHKSNLANCTAPSHVLEPVRACNDQQSNASHSHVFEPTSWVHSYESPLEVWTPKRWELRKCTQRRNANDYRLQLWFPDEPTVVHDPPARSFLDDFFVVKWILCAQVASHCDDDRHRIQCTKTICASASQFSMWDEDTNSVIVKCGTSVSDGLCAHSRARANFIHVIPSSANLLTSGRERMQGCHGVESKNTKFGIQVCVTDLHVRWIHSSLRGKTLSNDKTSRKSYSYFHLTFLFKNLSRGV